MPAFISASPGGSDTQVQYNNAGAFGGANLYWTANTLEQYNGSTGQSLFIYNVRTDAGNYDRGCFYFSANQLYLGTEKSGSGTKRNVRVVVGGDTKMIWESGGVKLQDDIYPQNNLYSCGIDGKLWGNVYTELLSMDATATSDTAPNDDTTIKKLSVQRLGSDPTNAAFIKFSNSPGTPTNDFYLVMVEG